MTWNSAHINKLHGCAKLQLFCLSRSLTKNGTQICGPCTEKVLSYSLLMLIDYSLLNFCKKTWPSMSRWFIFLFTTTSFSSNQKINSEILRHLGLFSVKIGCEYSLTHHTWWFAVKSSQRTTSSWHNFKSCQPQSWTRRLRGLDSEQQKTSVIQKWQTLARHLNDCWLS